LQGCNQRCRFEIAYRFYSDRTLRKVVGSDGRLDPEGVPKRRQSWWHCWSSLRQISRIEQALHPIEHFGWGERAGKGCDQLPHGSPAVNEWTELGVQIPGEEVVLPLTNHKHAETVYRHVTEMTLELIDVIHIVFPIVAGACQGPCTSVPLGAPLSCDRCGEV